MQTIKLTSHEIGYVKLALQEAARLCKNRQTAEQFHRANMAVYFQTDGNVRSDNMLNLPHPYGTPLACEVCGDHERLCRERGYHREDRE